MGVRVERATEPNEFAFTKAVQFSSIMCVVAVSQGEHTLRVFSQRLGESAGLPRLYTAIAIPIGLARITESQDRLGLTSFQSIRTSYSCFLQSVQHLPSSC